MVLVESYPVAVLMCVITMICWGSWANTQKLASKEWRFQLFYWDYCIGVLLLTLIFAFTLGSTGEGGRSFMDDLRQADMKYIGSALLGGVIFNIANILLVAAIDIAGMAVAFPIGIGLALVIGVITTYYASIRPATRCCCSPASPASPRRSSWMRWPIGAFRRRSKDDRQGIVLSVLCGVLMGQFFRFVAGRMPTDSIANRRSGNGRQAYAVHGAGVLRTGPVPVELRRQHAVMMKPFVGDPVPFSDYFTKGNLRLHLVGILGGMIWGVGMSFAILAGDAAGYAISYGLGQGATMVAALWGCSSGRNFRTRSRRHEQAARA